MMWVVIEYTDIYSGMKVFRVVPITWMNKTINTLQFPPRGWMQQRKSIQYPMSSWHTMNYDRIVFDNIGRTPYTLL